MVSPKRLVGPMPYLVLLRLGVVIILGLVLRYSIEKRTDRRKCKGVSESGNTCFPQGLGLLGCSPRSISFVRLYEHPRGGGGTQVYK